MTKKRLLFILQHVDAPWSVPMIFLAFLGFEWFTVHVLGLPIGTYDAGWFQALLLAAGAVIFATNVAVWGLFFTLRGFYYYLYPGSKSTNFPGRRAKDDWRDITPVQRLTVALFVLFALIALIIFVFIQFV